MNLQSGKMFLVAVIAASGFAFGGDYSTWAKYKTITLRTDSMNLSGNVTNVPILVRLTAANQPDMLNNAPTQILSGGADIRVTKADGVTDVPFEIESATTGASGAANIWVLADQVLQNSTSAASFRIYWGKAGATTLSSPSGVFSPSNGYQAVFHMQEATGNVTDAARGYVGTSTSTTTNAGGAIGAARTFAGGTGGVDDDAEATNYISFAPGATDPLSTHTGPITMEAWVYSSITNSANTSSGTKQILYHGAGDTNAHVWLKRTDGNTPTGSNHYAAGGANSNINGPEVPFGEGTSWNYIVAIWDGSHWTIHRNRISDPWGVPTITGGNTTPFVTSPGAGPGASTNPWYIGARSTNGIGGGMIRPWRGRLDEIRISTVARSASFIRVGFETVRTGGTALSVQTGSAPTLAYTGSPYTFPAGSAITPLTPTVTGSPTSYSISPPLANGTLALNTTNGVLTGTPANASSATIFTITATNASGAAQTQISITATGTTAAPSAPTGVAATVGNTQSVVSWTAPSSDGGAAITGYTVTATPGTATCNATPPATQCTVTGLTNGTSYTFTVRATNSVGPGTVSAPSNAVVPAVAPGAPTGVSGVLGNASVTVSWTAPASNGGSAIIAYTATASPGGSTCTWTTGPLSCTVGNLVNGTAYTFTVTATNPAGTGPASAASAAVTPRTRPGPPTSVAGTPGAQGSGQITAQWQAPASNGGSVITGYGVRAAPGGATCSWTTGPLTCLLTGLTPGTAYTLKAVAVNAAGTSDSSEASAAITPPVTIMPGSYVFRVTGTGQPYVFTLPASAVTGVETLTMRILDMQGRTVWEKTVNPSRDHVREISWNGTTLTGRDAAAGMHLVMVYIQNADATTATLHQHGVTLKPR